VSEVFGGDDDDNNVAAEEDDRAQNLDAREREIFLTTSYRKLAPAPFVSRASGQRRCMLERAGLRT